MDLWIIYFDILTRPINITRLAFHQILYKLSYNLKQAKVKAVKAVKSALEHNYITFKNNNCLLLKKKKSLVFTSHI